MYSVEVRTHQDGDWLRSDHDERPPESNLDHEVSDVLRTSSGERKRLPGPAWAIRTAGRSYIGCTEEQQQHTQQLDEKIGIPVTRRL